MNTIVAHQDDPFLRSAPEIRQASQSTMVEQSRAVAEVQAAVVVARQAPRDIQRAVAEMRQSCQMPRLAERAFFRYSRGDAQVTGASIHLARELARCWGNIDYGSKELRRDPGSGVSEMMAFSWDLEANSRSENTFIVPHVRDTRKGRKILEDQRDIYENNANAAARRQRECIFAVLPVWFIEEAKDICAETIRKGVSGNGKTLQQSIADCIAAFGTKGVTRQQMEAKIGRLAGEWIDQDVANLRVIFASISRGETTVSEEFPAIEPEPANGDAFERAAAGEAPQIEARPEAAAEPANDPFEIPENLRREPSAPPDDPGPPGNPEPAKDDVAWANDVQRLIEHAQRAKTLKELDTKVAAKWVRDLMLEMPEDKLAIVDDEIAEIRMRLQQGGG